MTPQSIIPFAYGDHLVRTILLEDRPWFVAKDVCAVLGIANHRDALSTLEEGEEKRTVGNTDGKPHSVGNADGKLRTSRTPRQLSYVNEPGLYRLIFKSRKAEARAFQRWVFHEVLPSLLRKGRYETSARADYDSGDDLSEAGAHFLRIIREQIHMGVSPDVAARMAGRVLPEPPQPLPSLSSITPDHHRDVEIDDILARLEPDRSYSIPQIAELLPKGHRLRRGSRMAQASAVGKILRRAVLLNRLERDWDFTRTVAYRLPSVAEFSATSTPYRE